MVTFVLTSARYALWSTLFVVLSLGVATAQVMQSTSFQIESDSVNVSGGSSQSSSYQLESTTGELATGPSDSTNFSVRAGFQQMQPVQIAMTAASAINLTPSIPGVAGGTANGSTSVTVITDGEAGYELTIAAATDPALQVSGESYTIADYTPSGTADYNFAIGSTDSHLGYSVESTDAASRFLYSGTTCDTGSTNTALQCWDGLSTTAAVASTRTSSNHPNGTDTKIHMRVGVGGSVVQEPGTYVGTTTLTALPL